MNLRPYQQRTLDCLYQWWLAHPAITDAPLLVLPTGAGKSVVIAELVRLLFDTWPDDHPRTVVIGPSKELAEQNADKLVRLLPSHITLGYYSASLGRKVPNADVIVATIGSIYKEAHLLGNIRAVIIDEAHLVNTDGAEAGRFRRFRSDLAKPCAFRVVGLNANPFRGNGVWLTEGDAPLFSGVAATVTVQELLDAGHLAPLVRPVDVATRIDTGNVRSTGGDYNIGDLARCVENYLPACADEAVKLAAGRRKWIAFLPTVAGADHFADLLNIRGIRTALVCGDTPKEKREQLIAQFRAGELRCLVTVLALATGFDVPDVDCILWLRPTISPVLYVQGAGRGLRPSAGKENCLWVDFSDTTERLGPVDLIKGRKKRARQEDRDAPHKVCDNCGERCQPRAIECPSCGFVFPETTGEAKPVVISNAAVMSGQLVAKLTTYPVTNVVYSIHCKDGSPDSLRADYYSGLRRVVSEWVCFDHQGFARAKADAWWRRRVPYGTTPTTYEAMQHADLIGLPAPAFVVVNESGKWPEIVRFEWEQKEAAA